VERDGIKEKLEIPEKEIIVLKFLQLKNDREVPKLTVERDGIKEKLEIPQKEIIVLKFLQLKNDRDFSTEQQLDSTRWALNEVKEGNSRTSVLIEQANPPQKELFLFCFYKMSTFSTNFF